MYGQYFVLFAILFTGWFLRKINFIDDKMNHSINKSYRPQYREP